MKTLIQKFQDPEKAAKIVGNILIALIAVAGATYCVIGIHMHYVKIF